MHYAVVARTSYHTTGMVHGSVSTLNLMAVSVIFALLGIQLNHGVDSHDGNACFDSTLKLLHFAHAGFQDTSLDGISYSALQELEPIVSIVLLLGDSFIGFVGNALLNTEGVGVTRA